MGMSFKQLVVWQRAVELSLATYKLTSGFPKSEQFGLTNQLRRAAVSIASNIAEGNGRSTTGEYLRQGNICSFSDTRVVRFLNCKHNLLSRRPCNSGRRLPEGSYAPLGGCQPNAECADSEIT